MSKNITLQKFQVEDIINIDSGDSVITITKFNGKVVMGDAAWTSTIELNIDQAIQLVNELNNRIGLFKKEVQNE